MKKLNFLNSVSSVVWGIPMLIIFLFTALRFTFKIRFAQVFRLPDILNSTINTSFFKKSENGVSSFGAFCSVLGACIGTGNIVGVATAIYSGGPGAVFWMVLSSIFSSATAYAENYLGASYLTRNRDNTPSGGAFAYIEKGIAMKGLARVYAFSTLASALGMGNMTQSNSLADSLKETFGFSVYVTGAITSVLCGIIILGGIRRIAKFQTYAVPVMTLFYLVLSFAVLIKFQSEIMPCIRLIIFNAFTPKALGGFGAYNSIRYGISRGVFSNEAGLGSSTLIHDQAQNSDARVRGKWAILEVYIDTIIMCTITALVILTSTGKSYLNTFGAGLSSKAYGTIGILGAKCIGTLTSVFAFTSLIGCSFYGEKSFQYLFGKKYLSLYKLLYVILIFIGAVNPPKIIWTIADICNGITAIPNLFALNTLARKVEFT